MVGLELCRIEDNSVVIEWQDKNRQLAGGSRQRTRCMLSMKEAGFRSHHGLVP